MPSILFVLFNIIFINGILHHSFVYALDQSPHSNNQMDTKESSLSVPKQEDLSRFQKLELFNKVLHFIETQYYRKVDTDKLIEGALKGMMDTLDPHSSFLNKEFFQKMKNDTNGEFGGLGIEVTQKDGVVYVITAIEDTPAFRAGIQSRDKIVEINHERVIGLDINKVVEKMKGKIGEKIHLGVARDGEEGIIHFNIKREVIKIKPVKYELIDNNFAYLRLTQFQKSSYSSVVNALKSMEKTIQPKKFHGIILDLRGNPGGLLDQAVDISSIFLKKGIVVTTESREPQNKDIRYVKKSGYKDLNTPMIVLIDGASASASEIVAGALQDYGRAIIMGSPSFGKGSVQTVAQLDKETGLKLTIAQYMTPKGRKIQAIGITPDVSLDKYHSDDLKKYKIKDQFIREKDLRGHLTATVETEREKQIRLQQDNDERKQKMKSLKNQTHRNHKNKKRSFLLNRTSPQEDDYVIQAIKHLKSIHIFNKSSLNKY